MNENLKAIIKAAEEDEELRAQVAAVMVEVESATDETRPEAVARAIALAQERGFTLTEEDLAVSAPVDGPLEDEELVVVSGGCNVDPCGPGFHGRDCTYGDNSSWI